MDRSGLSAFTDDTERLARFEREAKVLASLNHPNIAGIHGVEESTSVRALALELVEGPTLADRIAQGPIPIDEALPIARQIAEALEIAHDQSIVHRDLKPANIKLRPDGTVKILDFGLAKATVESSGDPSASPTITTAGTVGGVLLGTAAYMSPEQATGRPAGKPADVWAFGCVFFEMLTGQRAFLQHAGRGESASRVLESPRLERGQPHLVRGITSGLYSVPGAGGIPELVTRPDETRQELGHFAPRVLPHGRAVIYTAWRGFGNERRVMLYDRQTREHHTLAAGRRAWYSERGYVVYGVPGDDADDDLWVLPFDLPRLEATGPAFPVEEHVQSTFLGSGGTLMYVSGGRPSQIRSLVWVDRAGTETALDVPPAFYMEPRLSPTGDRLAVVITQRNNRDLWVLDLFRGTQARLTDHPDEDRLPLWTRDGKRIVFLRGGANSINNRTTLHWVAADAMGDEERLLAHDAVSVPVSWSRDGRILVLSDLFPGRGRDLGVLALGDKRVGEPLLSTPYDETAAAVSPDGRWIAYEATDSGQTEVYVRPFPDVERGRWQVSIDGGLPREITAVRNWDACLRDVVSSMR